MQQVQSQNDKMVPIDTSGDPVEVELKEDEKKEEVKTTEPEVQVEETAPVEKKEEGKEEELEEYSASVKRRIDKLTRKMREAERREQAAVDYAKRVQEENKNLQTVSRATSAERVASDEQSLQSTEQLLKTAYHKRLLKKKNLFNKSLGTLRLKKQLRLNLILKLKIGHRIINGLERTKQ